MNPPDSALVLLVVPEGIGYAALRRQAERYLDGRNGGVLLIRGHSRHFLQRLLPEQSRSHHRSAAAGVSGDDPVRVTARD